MLPLAEPVADQGDFGRETSFARILNISEVDWTEGSEAYSEWDRLGPNDSNPHRSGPHRNPVCQWRAVSRPGPGLSFLEEQRVAATSGKLVARVSPEAVGFKITTPHAVVIDRGAAFGVTIDPQRQTDVVVYEGMVDLALDKSELRKGPRLAAGEALRIRRYGQMGRIASVASDLFLPPPTLTDLAPSRGRLIASVTDNLKSSQTAKYYRVMSQGFREDCQAFVDRHHQWNGVDDLGIPPFLKGGDYVMSFNDDKVNAELRIPVALARPTRLYVLVDNRAPKNNWLAEGFTDTGWDVGIDEGYDDVAVKSRRRRGAEHREHLLGLDARSAQPVYRVAWTAAEHRRRLASAKGRVVDVWNCRDRSAAARGRQRKRLSELTA